MVNDINSRDLSLKEKLCLWYVMLGRSASDEKAKKGLSDKDSLNPLRAVFPGLDDTLRGKSIIDFGCADGGHTFDLARVGASFVLGVEILPRRLEKAVEKLKVQNDNLKVAFVQKLGIEHNDQFDIAISFNSFEHFSDPAHTLSEIYRALKKGGKLLMSFGPLWFSAYGPHQMEYTLSPWPHLIFDEYTVMKIRGFFVNDPEKRTYADRYLNKMSVNRFEQIIKQSKFQKEIVKYPCSYGLNFLGKFPLIRELAVNNVICVLTK